MPQVKKWRSSHISYTSLPMRKDFDSSYLLFIIWKYQGGEICRPDRKVIRMHPGQFTPKKNHC